MPISFAWISVPLVALLLATVIVITRRREIYSHMPNQKMPPTWLWISLPFSVMLLVVLVVIVRRRDSPPQGRHQRGGGGTCSSKCAALDPVSDPAYNMQQVVKQSILLEEHLTQERKRCKDCQLKHLLHIQGLVEEAVMLAGDRTKNYPLLDESTGFYSNMLKLWMDSGRDDAGVQLSIATQLRDWRKKLAQSYYVAA